jgi:hypothetical protein
MSSSASRGDRRRRVLNEDVLSASREAAAYDGKEDAKAAPGRRYALVAGDPSHMLATRVFPKSHWTTLIVALVMLVVCGGLMAGHFAQGSLPRGMANALLPLVDLQSPSSLGGWIASTLWTVLSMSCIAILVVRRRRADDFKGRYRCWGTAAAACLVLSLCSATELHVSLAAVLAMATRISVLAGHAIWWLVPTVLVGGWLSLRLMSEFKESRTALTLFVLGAIAHSAYLAIEIGNESLSLPITVAEFAAGLPLIGLAMLLTAAIAYARHIASQVATGATVAPLRLAESTISPKSAAKAERAEQRWQAKLVRNEAKVDVPPKADTAQAPTVQWTDGSDGAEDDESQGGHSRKLTKAERKRQRRQQQEQRHAA